MMTIGTSRNTPAPASAAAPGGMPCRSAAVDAARRTVAPRMPLPLSRLRERAGERAFLTLATSIAIRPSATPQAATNSFHFWTMCLFSSITEFQHATCPMRS